MKDLKKYDIDILKLSNKQHVYEFESDDSFFENFEQDLLKKGHFTTKLVLDKSETMLHLRFFITGEVELICDRSLEPFQHPLKIDQALILKYGEENQELTDEIEIIARDTQRINVAHYIFEFIGLALPMKKIHPNLRDQAVSQETEDAILVYSSGGETDTASEDHSDEAGIDPRWQALRKLKE